MRNSALKLATLVVLSMGCLLAGAQDNQQKLSAALGWLKKVQGGFTPEVKKDVPALESILRRYFLEPDNLRATEEDIALAFLDTMPKDSDLEARGGTLDKLKRFEALLGAKTTTTPPTPKATAKNPKPKRPKSVPVKVVVKRKIPGVHSKASFTAESRTAPGGKTIGVVQLNIAGRSKTVVEVLAGTSKLDAKKRAQVVALRMQSLNQSNRLWWTMLKVAQVKGQYVVGTGGKNFVITADSAFAREWGLMPNALASQLILKIRSSMDPEKSEQFGGRDLSAEELRIAAIDLRQQGDALYVSNPSGAEAKYKSAIANDSTYGVPYLRIADLHLAKKNLDGAKAILEEGIKVPGMSADQKASLESKLKSLG
ncbi:MAG: hypothetical protein H7Y17_16770 [Chlorobia bacterium]|nr:hypothetical protein [Fimbriimonadaceae bacterium]